MSKSKGTLQKPDAQFLFSADLINGETHQHATDWGTAAPRLTQFDELLAAAKAAYEASNNPAMKNAATAETKKAAFAELKNFLSLFINYLEGNPSVTDTQIAIMQLRPRHPEGRHPLPPPVDQPIISVRKQHGEITVYASRPEHDQPTSTVAPTHYDGFLLEYKFEGEAEYKNVVSTRLHKTLYFGSEYDGKRLFLKAAWVNSRIQHGPWSSEISEIIG